MRELISRTWKAKEALRTSVPSFKEAHNLYLNWVVYKHLKVFITEKKISSILSVLHKVGLVCSEIEAIQEWLIKRSSLFFLIWLPGTYLYVCSSMFFSIFSMFGGYCRRFEPQVLSVSICCTYNLSSMSANHKVTFFVNWLFNILIISYLRYFNIWNNSLLQSTVQS